jgi:hypothetical protein
LNIRVQLAPGPGIPTASGTRPRASAPRCAITMGVRLRRCSHDASPKTAPATDRAPATPTDRPMVTNGSDCARVAVPQLAPRWLSADTPRRRRTSRRQRCHRSATWRLDAERWAGARSLAPLEGCTTNGLQTGRPCWRTGSKVQAAGLHVWRPPAVSASNCEQPVHTCRLTRHTDRAALQAMGHDAPVCTKPETHTPSVQPRRVAPDGTSD